MYYISNRSTNQLKSALICKHIDVYYFKATLTPV